MGACCYKTFDLYLQPMIEWFILTSSTRDHLSILSLLTFLMGVLYIYHYKKSDIEMYN
jgi:hypothetical protein